MPMKISETERQRIAADMQAREAVKSPEEKASEAADIAAIQAITQEQIERTGIVPDVVWGQGSDGIYGMFDPETGHRYSDV